MRRWPATPPGVDWALTRALPVQVPGDLEIVAAALKRDRKQRLAVPICPSTYEADVASVHGARLPWSPWQQDLGLTAPRTSWAVH